MIKNMLLLKRKPEPGQKRPAWADAFWRGALFTLFFALTTAVLVFEFDSAIRTHGFFVGEPAPRTLFSPFSIAYVNEEATQALKKQSIQSVSEVFTLDPAVEKQAGERADQLFQVLNRVQTARALGQEIKEGDTGLPLGLSPATVKYLVDEPELEDVRKNLELLISQLFTPGILETQRKQQLTASGKKEILVQSAGAPSGTPKPPADLLSVDEARDRATKILPDTLAKKREQKAAVLDIFNRLAVPNLVYNETETQARRTAALAGVKPVEESIKKDELIVQRGMLVTAEDKRKVDQIQKKRTEKEIVNKISGTAIIVFIAHLILWVALFCFDRKMFRSLRMLTLFETVFFVSVLLCKIMKTGFDASPYLLPGALAPLTLVLLVNPRYGVLGSLIMASLLAPLVNFSPDVIMSVFLSGVAGTFSALKVRKRVEFLRVGCVTGLAVFAVLFAIRLFQEYTAMEAFQISAQGFVNGLLITMPFLFLSLAIFEYMFNLATDITLLELSDLNHPILKRMIIEAPGTYHHSLVVSRLAEGACEEIGANALLARVGAYFHDIGKIARSEFFTENQASKFPSRHEKLTPTMSSLVIINHVKDGLELGRKYKLKESVLKFIPEHQGTGVVYYFYRKATEQAAPGEKVNPDDFRYPGPKPQSRETAVTLLADSTEAASRSLKEPSAESIRSLVRKIINDKFIDGQLDECDLTLKDLHKIQESFVRNLMAIFHTRVAYPDKPKAQDSPDIFKEGEFQKYRLPHPNS